MNKKLVWILFGVLALIIGVLLFWIFRQHQEMTEMVEQMTIEKEELEEEYEDLAIQFDGYQQVDIRNDSLQDLLSREQQRVQDLLEEFRRLKEEKGMGIVIVSHSMDDVAALADRILVLSHGEKAMEGTPREVFAQAEKIQALGLDLPAVSRVLLKLKEKGLPVQTDALTVEEAVERITPLQSPKTT